MVWKAIREKYSVAMAIGYWQNIITAAAAVTSVIASLLLFALGICYGDCVIQMHKNTVIAFLKLDKNTKYIASLTEL